MVLVKVQAVDTEWISRKKEFSQKTNSVLTLCFSVCVPFYFNPAPPLPSFYNNTHPPTHPPTPQKKDIPAEIDCIEKKSKVTPVCKRSWLAFTATNIYTLRLTDRGEGCAYRAEVFHHSKAQGGPRQLSRY